MINTHKIAEKEYNIAKLALEVGFGEHNLKERLCLLESGEEYEACVGLLKAIKEEQCTNHLKEGLY